MKRLRGRGGVKVKVELEGEVEDERVIDLLEKKFEEVKVKGEVRGRLNMWGRGLI